MKRTVWIDFSLSKETASVLDWLKNFRVFLLDSNVLKAIAYGEQTRVVQPLTRLMTEGGKIGSCGVCGIADFIKIECFNVERYELGSVKIRRFLKKVEKSADGFYVELRTPIRMVPADNRKKFLNFLPRKERNVLLKRYEDLSGTDASLLVLAAFLKVYRLSVVVTSFDRSVTESSRELEIPVYPGNPKSVNASSPIK